MPSIRILVSNRQKRKRINLKEISNISSRILQILGKKKAELSISFVSDPIIIGLNRKYFASRQSTDVLAFPMNDPYFLGDVVISIDRTLSQARIYGQPFKKELIRLIIHGILHLIGYSDKKKNDRARIENKQERILNIVYEST